MDFKLLICTLNLMVIQLAAGSDSRKTHRNNLETLKGNSRHGTQTTINHCCRNSESLFTAGDPGTYYCQEVPKKISTVWKCQNLQENNSKRSTTHIQTATAVSTCVTKYPFLRNKHISTFWYTCFLGQKHQNLSRANSWERNCRRAKTSLTVHWALRWIH